MSMHRKAIVFSIELLQEMITQGWEIGTDRIVRCTTGLPAFATFEYVEPSADNCIVLVFSHPTWPAVTSVDNVPRETVQWTRYMLEEPRNVPL